MQSRIAIATNGAFKARPQTLFSYLLAIRRISNAKAWNSFCSDLVSLLEKYSNVVELVCLGMPDQWEQFINKKWYLTWPDEKVIHQILLSSRFTAIVPIKADNSTILFSFTARWTAVNWNDFERKNLMENAFPIHGRTQTAKGGRFSQGKDLRSNCLGRTNLLCWFPIKVVMTRNCGNSLTNERAIIILIKHALRCACTNLGPLAQLGERLHGMEEVIGSNPTWSTT